MFQHISATQVYRRGSPRIGFSIQDTPLYESPLIKLTYTTWGYCPTPSEPNLLQMYAHSMDDPEPRFYTFTTAGRFERLTLALVHTGSRATAIQPLCKLPPCPSGAVYHYAPWLFYLTGDLNLCRFNGMDPRPGYCQLALTLESNTTSHLTLDLRFSSSHYRNTLSLQ